MIYIDGERTDPAFNLALEEYVFERLPRDRACFMTWQNDNTVVIGRYQNAFEEVNREFVKAHDIRVVRRLSGGGAVYHDLGNLNYTIITDHAPGAEFDFSALASLVVDVLSEWGIPAELSGRNDITICGAKVCGCSQYVRHGRLLHHGCILVDADLERAAAALKPNPEKYKGRGVKSVRSRIDNVSAYAPNPISAAMLKAALREHIEDKFALEPYRLTAADIAEIEQIRTQKYATDEWNWGSMPAYSLRRELRCAAGVVTADMLVEDGVLQNVHFSGDFFGQGDLAELENILRGKPLNAPLREIIEQAEPDFYIKGITPRELYELLTGAAWE